MDMEFQTKLLHGKSVDNYANGSTVPPISLANAFAYESSEQLEKVFQNRAPGFAYTRIANPTVDAFERRVNELEGGIGGVACSSGMSAVTLSLLNILQAGDEVIAGSASFGGTLDLLHDLEAFGIKVHFIPRVEKELIEPLLTERTKAVFGEIIGNPALNVMDVRETADFLHGKGVPLIVDSTTATPYLLNPIQYGADVVVHSTSKYINGSGDAISGIIIDSGNFSWNPERYPGMKEYKKYGKFAYLVKLTIRTGSKERAYQLINHLKYVKIATNIGDVRTLVIHPASTIYIHSTPEAMAEAGVYADTIRISVGIEDAKDLIQDFTEAVESLKED